MPHDGDDEGVDIKNKSVPTADYVHLSPAGYARNALKSNVLMGFKMVKGRMERLFTLGAEKGFGVHMKNMESKIPYETRPDPERKAKGKGEIVSMTVEHFVELADAVGYNPKSLIPDGLIQQARIEACRDGHHPIQTGDSLP